MKIGIDILEIKRIKTTKTFMEKILTENEINYVEKYKNKAEKIAGIFCGKEAVFKALNLKIFKPKLIEIVHNENGRPLVNLKEEYLNYFKQNYKNIDISITHCKTLAQAICLVEI